MTDTIDSTEDWEHQTIISYSDFLSLCRMKDEILEPRFEVGRDGDLGPFGIFNLYRNDEAAIHDMTPNARAAATEHPEHDIQRPYLIFPCSLAKIRWFMEKYGSYGCIDAFDLAEFVYNRLTGGEVVSDKSITDLNERLQQIEKENIELKTKLAFLERDNPRYTPKLAAVVEAWNTYEPKNGKTTKQNLINWLEDHAGEYLGKNGKPLSGIEELAAVANWDTGGGAPKTPSKKNLP